MGGFVLVLVPCVLALALAVLWRRHEEKKRLAAMRDERHKAKARGTDRARLQYPSIDLARCIGCGACVDSCPEDSVLGMMHGQAVVLHGARCVGHGKCAEACPTGAIVVTLGDLTRRDDIPVVDERFEVEGVRGLHLAGEVTGWSLVRTAVVQGVGVVDHVARRLSSEGRSVGRPPGHHRLADAPAEPEVEGVLDLVVVGAGPAGLAAALRAKEKGLAFRVLEQEELGGTVAKYPRRKLVMTQPMELPLAGRLDRTSFEKEELVELWTRLAREHELPITTGVVVQAVERLDEGLLRVRAKDGAWTARNVLLALGRRGTPRRLGVPGEDLAKVAYSLLDAQGYEGRRILVVGGGDSAVEAALGLAETGNEVVLSYRQAAFSRLRPRNEARILEAIAKRELRMEWESELVSVSADHVVLRTQRGEARLENDEVFIFAGGTPPFELLKRSGVSFDHGEARQPQTADDGGLVKALAVALLASLVVLAAAWWWRDYYFAPRQERPLHALHAWLRPSSGLGLALGIAALALIACNLLYLLRRAEKMPWPKASLQAWMSAHVATGVGAFLLAAMHGGFDTRQTVGGHAFWALAFLVVTGAIGRWFYSFVPRAANGRELALEEVHARLAALSTEWDQRSTFARKVDANVQALVAEGRWEGGFFARVLALRQGQARLRERLAELRKAGEAEGVAPDQLEALLDLARRAQRTALMAAHYEDLRAILGSWRWFHRWVALFMVLVVGVHVWAALRYGAFVD